MRIRYSILIAEILCYGFMASAAMASKKVIVTQKDKSILKQEFDKFSNQRDLSVGALMLRIGLDFVGTPYVTKTLDLNPEENLVVNLREFDCTTFVESCLAIALSLKNGQPDYNQYIAQLERVRYRNGRLEGYTSRLHYFSEWITDNENKGVVKDVTAGLGGIGHPVLLNFMGNHPDFYPQLKADPSQIVRLRQIEKKISAHPFYFIPKEKIADHEPEMMDGDIVALTTKIPGLDVSHLGLISKKNGVVFLLNASSADGRVEITRLPLVEYLKGLKNVTGIFVVRTK